jgi:3-oxo-5-alpha-steroid 4-dehydrogenase 3 / polyprenol reductase
MGQVMSTEAAKAMTPAQATRAFYLSTSAFIAGVQLLPADVRTALMDYGARRPGETISIKKDDKASPVATGSESPKSSLLTKLKEFIAHLTNYGQVPHSWFLHFYILSMGWSVFWALQFLTRGKLMAKLAAAQASSGAPGMEMSQVYIAWAMMLIQGARRLYESLYVTKMGTSPMWFIHWLLALSYYTANSMAVWVEGSGEF